MLGLGSAEDGSLAGPGSSLAIGSDETCSISTCLADGSAVAASDSAFNRNIIDDMPIESIQPNQLIGFNRANHA